MNDYIRNGPATPNVYADIDWDEWDRPSAERVEAVYSMFDRFKCPVIYPKPSSGHIALLILEQAGRVQRLTQDKLTVTWSKREAM